MADIAGATSLLIPLYMAVHSSQFPIPQPRRDNRQSRRRATGALEISRHCKHRMDERGISLEEVTNCVCKGNLITGGRDKCTKMIPNDVVVLLDVLDNRVVTAYRTPAPEA